MWCVCVSFFSLFLFLYHFFLVLISWYFGWKYILSTIWFMWFELQIYLSCISLTTYTIIILDWIVAVNLKCHVYISQSNFARRWMMYAYLCIYTICMYVTIEKPTAKKNKCLILVKESFKAAKEVKLRAMIKYRNQHVAK